jgi:hypothetical protein
MGFISVRSALHIRRPAALAAIATVLVALAALPPAASAASAVPAAPVVVDGPTAGIVALRGMSIARDGTGGIVYVKQVGGVAHVFVSRLVGGSFLPPERVDASLPGNSSEPVIAAGRGGLLLVAFINGGQLYVVGRAHVSTPFGQPRGLSGGASHPAISITDFGKAYLAYTLDAGGGKHDVRAAYYFNGRWSLEPTALDAFAAEDAGSGAGAPQVSASGDGVGTVVWGEAGHIYSRRVWGTSPSIVYEQADVPSLSGWTEVTSDTPVAGSGGNSSYVAVAFHEVLRSGAQLQSRVLMRRLHASIFDPLTQPDSLRTPGSEGAVQPRAAVGEYGSGLVTSVRDHSNQVFAALLDGDAHQASTMRVDSGTNLGPPYAVPAMAGLFSDLVSWQHDPGPFGPRDIRLRYSDDGSNLGPEQVVSHGNLGPTDAARGLVAGGDVDGNAAVGWVQGAGASSRIVTAQLYWPPGDFGARRRIEYARRRHPRLRWTQAREHWGLRYTVRLDGRQVGQTGGTWLVVRRSLSDGPHRWQVTATNPAGQATVARAATVWVDTVRPTGRVQVRGSHKAGAGLRVRVGYRDVGPGGRVKLASGVAKVTVKWGDGSLARLRRGRHLRFHAYRAPGRYKLTVIITDRAGNRRVLVRRISIHG